ncbi:MAG: acyl-CoA thioesterase [Alphaproteobacteria bacterium]|nr:acyl-CoA thioesterase [Alphaproteobacteria bacterium]MCB9699711.1 acyl-CoA thioesterase [Alphaproteobacteria bacterium]
MTDAFSRRALIEAPEGFGRDQQVPFHHVDAAGIVFFGRVFEWFHELYVAFLEDAGFPLPEQLRGGTIAPLAHADADYLAPLRFGDAIRVAMVQADVTADRVRLGYRVTGPSGPAVVGSVVHVFVDPKSFQRVAMPAGLRAAFERISRP